MGFGLGGKSGAVPSFLDESSHSAYSSVSISLQEARQLLDRAVAHMVVIPRIAELKVSLTAMHVLLDKINSLLITQSAFSAFLLSHITQCKRVKFE